MFGEEWWKQAPFTLASSFKTPSDYLVDYMADLAALFNDVKRTRQMTQENLDTGLEYRARAILHQLFSWRWWWQARNLNSVFEIESQNTTAFDTVLRFINPQLMYEIWLCDALLILLLGMLSPSGTQDGFAALTSALWTPCETSSVRQPAIEICRSFEYHLQNLSAPAPVHQWALPLALAYVTLPATDPVAEWVMSKILAAPPSRKIPWLVHIERLQGKDQAAARDVFACWPVKRDLV